MAHGADTPAPGAAAGPHELPVFILTGPTGAGKTDWALGLAESAPGEIVSVDSALVYKGLDSGTANPAREPRATPLRRAQLDARPAKHGWPALHAELAGLDPEAAARIAPADRQRIQRALEVCYTTGRPISQLQRATVSPLAGWQLRYWVLAPRKRAVLHERIARRFDAMMAAGFLDEVIGLRRSGDLSARHPSMRAVGYRQLWAHLDGQCALEEGVQRAVAATRQLAKRQLTWMRSEALGEWIDPDSQLSWNRDICHELARLGL